MRRTLLACILGLGLLLAPLALAEGGPGARGADKAAEAKLHRSDHANATHGGGGDNETDDGDDDNETGEGHGRRHDANATRAEGKPAWVSALRVRLAELRASWLENATSIRESCHAAEKPGNNSSSEDRRAWSHCIRDGYKAWFELLRAERAEARAARPAHDG